MKLTEQQVPEVFRDPDGRGVVAWLPHFNPERVVETWLVSFEQPITGLRRDQPHRSKVRGHALDRWLSRIDPRDIECRADHEDEEIGSWFRFRALDMGVMGSMHIDEGVAGDQLLHVLDRDESWGFSFSARSSGRMHIERDEHGEPFDVYEGLDIIEAGPTPTPADRMAYVVRIAGKSPKWMTRMDGLERDRLMRNLGVVPASAAWPGRRGWG